MLSNLSSYFQKRSKIQFVSEIRILWLETKGAILCDFKAFSSFFSSFIVNMEPDISHFGIESKIIPI
jgi:hypothetical protein